MTCLIAFFHHMSVINHLLNKLAGFYVLCVKPKDEFMFLHVTGNVNRQESRRPICIHCRYLCVCVSACASLPGALRARAVRTGSFILADVPINQPDTDGDPGCPHHHTHTHTTLTHICSPTLSYWSFVEQQSFCSHREERTVCVCHCNTHTHKGEVHDEVLCWTCRR